MPALLKWTIRSAPGVSPGHARCRSPWPSRSSGRIRRSEERLIDAVEEARRVEVGAGHHHDRADPALRIDAHLCVETAPASFLEQVSTHRSASPTCQPSVIGTTLPSRSSWVSSNCWVPARAGPTGPRAGPGGSVPKLRALPTRPPNARPVQVVVPDAQPIALIVPPELAVGHEAFQQIGERVASQVSDAWLSGSAIPTATHLPAERCKHVRLHVVRIGRAGRTSR